MTLKLIKLIGTMKQLMRLKLSGIVIYDTQQLLMDLSHLSNMRSLSFRAIYIKCEHCNALTRWTQCGDIIKELLPNFPLLEEFHFYDKIKDSREMFQIADALSQVRFLHRVTLPCIDDKVCQQLAEIENLN